MKRLLLVLGVVVALGVLAVAGLIGVVWYENAYKSIVQTVEVENSNDQFVLMTNYSGFGDQAWSVYRLPIGASVTSEMRDGGSTAGALFWNYTEAGDHSEGARLTVVQDRYLVFSRGGLRHSLYDMAADSVLVNEPSPWHAFLDSTDVPPRTPLKEERALMDEWVREHLDGRIRAILRGAAEPTAAGRHNA
jgi:hypothetical protein